MEARHPQHREAHLWKDQGQLTHLGIVPDKLDLQDAMRVNIALRVIRRAYTHGSKAKKEQLKLSQHAKDADEYDPPLGSHLPYGEMKEFRIKPIEQIQIEAKKTFAITKEMMKIERERQKFGKLRPICTALTAEIRAEMERKEDERLFGPSESQVGGGNRSRRGSVGSKRQRSRRSSRGGESNTAAAGGAKKRPSSATAVMSRGSGATKNDTAVSGHSRRGSKSSHDPHHKHRHSVQSHATTGSRRSNNNNNNIDDNDDNQDHAECGQYREDRRVSEHAQGIIEALHIDTHFARSSDSNRSSTRNSIKDSDRFQQQQSKSQSKIARQRPSSASADLSHHRSHQQQSSSRQKDIQIIDSGDNDELQQQQSQQQQSQQRSAFTQRRHDVAPHKREAWAGSQPESGTADGDDKNNQSGKRKESIYSRYNPMKLKAERDRRLAGGNVGTAAAGGAGVGGAGSSTPESKTAKNLHNHIQAAAISQQQEDLIPLPTVASNELDGSGSSVIGDEYRDVVLLDESNGCSGPLPSKMKRSSFTLDMWGRQASMSSMQGGGGGGSADNNNNNNALNRTYSGGGVGMLYRQQSMDSAAPRSPSGGHAGWGSPGGVHDDARIQKALSKRDEIQQLKEEAILRKIEDREQVNAARALARERELRQRAWLVCVAALSRTRAATVLVRRYRDNLLEGEFYQATQRSIALIRKWWERKRIMLKLRRSPKAANVMCRLFLPYFSRFRFRRKTRCVNLLKTFIHDMTGLAETMRAIYRFRSKIIKIQRWVRSWLEIQMARMRILWMKCERLYRINESNERSNRKKNLSNSLRNLSSLEGFTGTVQDIKSKRNKLHKYLLEQEEARHIREWEESDQKSREIEQQIKTQQLIEMKKQQQKRRQSQIQSQKLLISKEAVETLFTVELKENSITAALSSEDPAAAWEAAKKAVEEEEEAAKRAVGKRSIPWHKKVRSRPENIRIFDYLREILKIQRKRHVLNLANQQKQYIDSNPVDVGILKRYLKNPSTYDYLGIITHSIAVVTKPDEGKILYHKFPFLLLTQGALTSMEILLAGNKTIKFS